MSRRGMLGFAAAACVASCAGPFLAAIGGSAALGLVGTIAFAVVALAVTVVAIGVVISVPLRLRAKAPRSGDPVKVELGPTRQ